MRILAWFLLSSGGLLGLLALVAAGFFILVTGGVWFSGGKFTEGLGSLMIGVVVVAVALLSGALLAAGGFILLAMTAH